MRVLVGPAALRVVGLGVFALLIGCNDAPRNAVLPRGSTVLALGDSLTFGTGATPEASYPSILAEASGWDVVNAGIPGDTAAEGCARLPGLIEEHRPKLVLVLLGGNDFLGRMPERSVVDALERCVESARASHAAVALIVVPRFGASGISDAPLYAAAGKAWNVAVLDAGLSALLAQRAMRADAVHLNAIGYREMALTLIHQLREHGWLSQ
jgi:acyl-CoA thioesterase-1